MASSTSSPSTHRTKRPYQPQITSFYPSTTLPDRLHAQSSSSSSSPFPSSSTPPLPTHIQSNLLNVGMRIRKSVPEGYKTHLSKSDSDVAFVSSLRDRETMAGAGRGAMGWSLPSTATNTAPNISNVDGAGGRGELTPFCGIHKIGGLDVQQPGTDSHANSSQYQYQYHPPYPSSYSTSTYTSTASTTSSSSSFFSAPSLTSSASTFPSSSSSTSTTPTYNILTALPPITPPPPPTLHPRKRSLADLSSSDGESPDRYGDGEGEEENDDIDAVLLNAMDDDDKNNAKQDSVSPRTRLFNGIHTPVKVDMADITGKRGRIFARPRGRGRKTKNQEMMGLGKEKAGGVLVVVETETEGQAMDFDLDRDFEEAPFLEPLAAMELD
ncbi:hypothetical protein K402DRAFT_393850 [Aulographum hederae CBS 113979]|uniref:Uncharacterized protein n=1 Tax=Aulographum hederae CBS 113979 TaxID=1176131 RepID=A0A6G1GZI9_9PEZI|nr:hypothetical protein K402DRAFT_393850 [Aulographum hederae CBS 113979]